MLQAADILEARERLNAIHDASIASGWAKKGSVNEHIRYLERRARAGREAGSQPKRRAVSIAELASHGIPIVTVPKKGAD